MRLLIVWFALGTAAVPALASAQERPDSATMVQLAGPGPEHARLARLAGEWSVDVAFPSPGGQPSSVQARAVNRTIMGGRFLTTEVKGSAQGMPFESLTILGFDRGPGEYTAVGYDTFGTFYVTAAGGWDESRKTIVMKGSYDDATTRHAHDYEFLLAIESPDRFTWTVVFLEGDRRNVAVTASYRRR